MGARGTLRSSPGGLAILFVKGEARCVDRRHIETGAQLAGLIVESEAWRTDRAERERRAQLALRIVKVQPRRAVRFDIQRDPRLAFDVGEIQSHRAIGQNTDRAANRSKPAVGALKFSLFTFQALKMLDQSCLRLLHVNQHWFTPGRRGPL